MKASRRRFVAGLLAAPVMARAQADARGPVRTLGFLTDGPGRPARLLSRLAEHGHVEGRNFRFELRRVPVGASAAELERVAVEMVRAGADVLVASGVDHVSALRNATSRIPIVCGGVSNPVGLGLAESLGRPGKNVTGFSYGLPEAAVLQMGAMKAIRPRLKRLIFMVAEDDPKDVGPEHGAAASAAGVVVELASMKSLKDVDRVFATIPDPGAGAAWIAPLPKDVPADQVAARAIRRRVATHAMGVEEVRSGLLMSYWLAHSEGGKRLASLIDKVLRGANPAQIPFELPDVAKLYINRATATAIGVHLSDDLLLRATEVVG